MAKILRLQNSRLDWIYFTYILQGKMKYKEQVFEGFEKLPEAFISMINGENIGKTNVRA